MRVLFILEDYIIDPLGIGYLSSYLKLAGHTVDLVNIDYESLTKKVESYQPDVFAYSLTTGRHTKFRDINQRLKEKYADVFSLFGGPHCTFYPEFAKEPDVDAICVGEGFIGFERLLAALEEGQPIREIPNILTANQLYGDNAPLMDMDSVPFPDRALMYKYPKNRENPIRSIIASFQCGLGCRYCLDEDTLIMRSDGTMLEIKHLQIGDVVIGVEQNNKKEWYSTHSVIENIWQTKEPAYKIMLDDGTQVICSGNHKWLSDRGGQKEWKTTAKQIVNKRYAPYLTTKNRIRGFGQLPKTPPLTVKLEGLAIKNSRQIVSIVPLHEDRVMYDITTSTENFIANGLVSHNCYAPKYRELYEMGDGFKNVAVRSAERVADEAATVATNWHTELFYFQDDVFPVWKKGWVDDFVARWNGYSFHIQIRAEMINDALIKKLKSVGLHGVTFAVESGVDHIRRKVLNRNMSNEQIIEASRVLRDNDVRFRIENMMGVMGETFSDAMETLRLNIKCKPDLGWASLWQPYPGTELGDEAVKKGLFNPNSDEIGFDFFHDTILVGKESRLISNLQKLFGVAVRYPQVLPLIPALCHLPKNRFYESIYRWFKQRTYESRLYKVKPFLRGSKQMSEGTHEHLCTPSEGYNATN